MEESDCAGHEFPPDLAGYAADLLDIMRCISGYPVPVGLRNELHYRALYAESILTSGHQSPEQSITTALAHLMTAARNVSEHLVPRLQRALELHLGCVLDALGSRPDPRNPGHLLPPTDADLRRVEEAREIALQEWQLAEVLPAWVAAVQKAVDDYPFDPADLPDHETLPDVNVDRIRLVWLDFLKYVEPAAARGTIAPL